MQSVLLTGGLALLMAALPASALAETSKAAKDPKVETIIIKRHKANGQASDEHKISVLASDCKDEAETVEVTAADDGDKQKHTQVIICGKRDAQMIAALERARDSIARRNALSEDYTDRIVTALDARIAALKGSQAPAR